MIRVGFAALIAAMMVMLGGCGAQINSFNDLQTALNEVNNDLAHQAHPSTPSTPSVSGGSTSSGSSVSVNNSAELNAMVARHNATRKALGLSPLTVDPRLMNTAQSQAAYNASIGRLDHSDASGGNVGTRATDAGYTWHAVGENIAYAGTAERVYSGWLGSSGHYHNITNPIYSHIGVGRVVKGGREYWCADFGAPQ